jgi:hypothetical protein
MLVNRLEVLAVSKRILQNKLDVGLLLSASAAPRSFDDNETLFDVQRASSLHLERAETSHERWCEDSILSANHYYYH